jgi:hypothetical protein
MSGRTVDPVLQSVTQAELPSKVTPYPRIEGVLTCIRQTQALSGRVFVVGPFADSTGKVNSVASGATGAFVPQGGSAAYVTDAITKAGGRVISTYFGPPAVNAPAQYMINGIFNSLDFGMPLSADMQIAGIGPTFQQGWAQLSLTIQLDEAGTRLNRQMSMIQRPVRYSESGLTMGAVVGHTLVTGAIAAQNQERLQLEALNGPIALGVADVLLKEFPAARAQCGSLVSDLLPDTAAPPPMPVEAAPPPMPPQPAPAPPPPRSAQSPPKVQQRLVARRAPRAAAARTRPAVAAEAGPGPVLTAAGVPSFHVVLTAAQSLAAAKKTQADLSRRYGPILDGRQLFVGQGVNLRLYPVFASGMDRQTAEQFCGRIRSKGGECSIVAAIRAP